jgi:hypothetical protein
MVLLVYCNNNDNNYNNYYYYQYYLTINKPQGKDGQTI